MGNSDDSNHSEDTPVETTAEPSQPEFVDWGSSNLLTHGQPQDLIEFRHERDK